MKIRNTNINIMLETIIIYFFFISLIIFIFNKECLCESYQNIFPGLLTGARAAGMGDAQVAGADNNESIYWNPAGLNKIDQQQISINRTIFDMSDSLSYLSYSTPVEGIKKSIGFEAGWITDHDKIFIISAAGIIKNIPMGINLKLCKNKYNEHIIKTFDFGCMYNKADSKMTTGVLIQNILSIKDPLPFNIKFGVSYKMLDDLLTIAVDIGFGFLSNLHLNCGAEYYFQRKENSSIIGRIGFKTPVKYDDIWSKGISIGFGYRNKQIGIDYALIPYDIYGVSNRLTLNYKFGKIFYY